MSSRGREDVYLVVHKLEWSESRAKVHLVVQKGVDAAGSFMCFLDTQTLWTIEYQISIDICISI